jgi:ABC-type Mn2+/Zn2+ transport system ATPase subunit
MTNSNRKPDLNRVEPARLELRDVSAGYNGKMVLRDVSFQVPHGARVAVVGPNGAGKSTLFKVLVGLLPVRSGQVLIHGLPLGAHQECVAYVPQRNEIDWRFPVTVSDVVMMGRFGQLGRFQRPTKRDHDIVLHCLDQMDIANLADRRTHRRAAAARVSGARLGARAAHPVDG